jgi:hypothetical protein
MIRNEILEKSGYDSAKTGQMGRQSGKCEFKRLDDPGAEAPDRRVTANHLTESSGMSCLRENLLHAEGG